MNLFLFSMRIVCICLLLSVLSVAKASEGGSNKADSLYFALSKPFVVNLSSKSGLSYLQVNVQFKLKKAALRKKFKNQLPAIENDMIMLLSDQTVDSIKSVKGKQALRKSALKSVQEVCDKLIGSPVIDDVYFTGFIIQ